MFIFVLIDNIFLLWYGFIYYIIALFTITFFAIAAMRLFYVSHIYRFTLVNTLVKYVLSFFVLFGLLALTVLYYLLDFFSTFTLTVGSSPVSLQFFDTSTFDYLIHTSHLSLHLTSIYYFPFIYIFILITILSILFCLSYNTNELIGFIFYCTVILLSGYILFFTDSLILFFLAYEMLLVPSFFIHYNFAKTRRCVEAAYLMFFWTQFGAMFLIFSFLYLFFITNTSSFTALNAYYFTTFELNFLFFCWLVGFGVKLPIWPFYG